MADILSRDMGAQRVVGHSPQNDENDVRVYESNLKVKWLWEPN